MESHDGYIQVKGGKIYWKSVGEGDKTPILVLHGGPGFSHKPLVSSFEKISRSRRVYFYDQLGSGKSDRPNDLGLWTIDRFVEEIITIRNELELNQIILWGGSWGTMLGVDYLLTQPEGVLGVILSNPCLSAKMWKLDADRLRKKLPEKVQEVLREHESCGTTDSKEYEEAMWEYLKRFACLIDPIPQEILDEFTDANQIIYNYMWGPSEFFPTGTLRDYDRTKGLYKIKHPTLFICGREDEATPESTEFYANQMPNAEFKVIENASHMAMLEKPEKYSELIENFLNQIEL
ncbi:MAG: proline iminopeptidase [Bdellovibrionaceae bacterium]|nr:proline iminopeptidase [Pseudobdellovibrionaceae bacterium]|tara:strand:- start:510 stop:1382 length:873 start_codon:yes stop_codon:yes gene_type:complete